MREIKFRAWLNGKMNIGSMAWLLKQLTEAEVGFEESILMQYTGLKDKNGKEIYEGDVVSCVGGYEVGEDDGPAVVAWNDKLLRWDAEGLCPLHEFDLSEVIGNIYEHPELLAASL